MTRTEYERIRARIDARYQSDVAALERIWKEFNGEEELPVAEEPVRRRRKPSGRKLSAEEQRERRRAYHKAWLARKKAGTVGTSERGVKNFPKFLVPTEAGGNGRE